MTGARSWLCLVAVCALALVAGGCYDRIELNELAIADMLAIDRTEDGLLKVSLQFLIPAELTNPGGVGASSGLRDPFYVLDAVGKTLPEAFSLLQAKLSRRLFTPHIRLILIGEELARSGIGPVFDSLTRMPELRIFADVVVTQGEASTLLRAAPRLGRLPVSALANTLHQKIVPVRTVREIAIALVSEGIDPFVPAVGLARRIETELEAGARAQEYEITGVGIFRGDKLVGFAPLDLARGLAWLVDEAPFAAVTIPWPPKPDDRPKPREASDLPLEERMIESESPPGTGPAGPGGGLKDPNQITPLVLRARVNLSTEVKDGQLAVRVEARAVDDIVTNQAGLDLTDPKVLPALEKALGDAVKERMEALLRLAQEELNADVFGFGALIRRNHPELWRELRQNWHEHFRRLPVHITVDVIVRRTGLTSNPAAYRPSQLTK